ncbi:hypothetical protein L596_023155 [Steinernema carpocapsae]|uniref:Peptidoglycan binding-like domain-containing protein n=1 Tax=Steinernema carpocapsae TaxID=34508 RepID=A0A4U5MDL3_STECR|nr:hypothetical protein L596_023155 [Steinernema carpocapsae]
MASLRVCLILSLLVACTALALNIRQEDIEYLERFGYIDNSGPPAQRTEEFLTEKIKEFQEMAALPQTGEMDGETRRMMGAPRCGRRDLSGSKERFRRHHRSRRRVRYTSKWPKNDLTFWQK